MMFVQRNAGTDGSTISKIDARSKSPGMRLLASAVIVGSSLPSSGNIEYPTHANAWAKRLQQMKRVALDAIALGAERKRSGTGSRNTFRRRRHA